MGQRGETLMRIPVAIVSGIIIWAWGYLIGVFFVINFLWSLISGKRIKDIAELSEVWNTQSYTLMRYLVFVTNERPFPFAPLAKSITAYNSGKVVKK